MNVLIVDDHPGNRKLLRVSLEAEGHHVCDASNGREALRMLREQTVHAVISDILMPVMDGFRLCREIRSSPDFSGLPLVLYTSTYSSVSDRELAKSVGADAYILKPAPVPTLLRAIAEAQRSGSRRRTVIDPPFEEAEVLEHYNAVLVRKLESRNTELHEALTNLRKAHDQILDLNRNLETRVAQRTAALDAANKELEAFSYSVAHDLRAPLRHLIGFSQLLKDTSAERLDDDGRKSLAQIERSALHMDQLIHDLLEFAKSARTTLQLVDVDLEAVLEKALSAASKESEGRSIEWRRTTLPHIHGDAALLHQVFVNLLSNAIKYTRPRTKAIIEIGTRPGRAEEVVIYVRDNGVGFDARRTGELFGVFRRLHSAEEFEGTGVGLALAYRIIARHGGAIWADAAPDRGATFYLSLRRAGPDS